MPDEEVPLLNPKTQEPILKNGRPVMKLEKRQCALGREEIAYTCVALSAGMFADYVATRRPVKGK